MFRKILDSIIRACLEGYQWGYNLGRYGDSKGPPKSELKINIDDDHKDLAEKIFNSSCMTLTESGIMYPTFFLIKGDSFMPIVADPESVGKTNIQGFASEVTSLADDTDAEAMMFVSEQWYVKRKLDDDEIKKFEEGKLLPNLDPDRQEALTLIYITCKGEIQTLMGEIQRGADNTPFVRDSKWSEHDEKASTSLFQPWR